MAGELSQRNIRVAARAASRQARVFGRLVDAYQLESDESARDRDILESYAALLDKSGQSVMAQTVRQAVQQAASQIGAQ
jgi:hypothetical protein